MSYLKLLWALSNGASTSGMVLAIYRSSFPINSPFASPNITGLSVTHFGYWHPLLPAILLRNHNPNTSVHSIRAPQSKLQRIQVISARESGVIFFKKKREVHTPSRKELQNYGVQTNSSRKPFTSFPHNLQIFHVPWDLNLAKYWPRHGSLFDWAIQITKVCKYLPTHKLHISAVERTWSDISTIGEDHTLWVTQEYHWETWTSFEKNSYKKIRDGNLNR